MAEKILWAGVEDIGSMGSLQAWFVAISLQLAHSRTQ